VVERKELATHPDLLTPIHGIVEDPQVAVLARDLDAAGFVIIIIVDDDGGVYPPAVAWAVWSGRCWLRARCRCAALPVLC
jgi:hypothetical protein